MLPGKKCSDMRKKWIDALQLPPDIDDPFYVCGDHFQKTDFQCSMTSSGLRRRLRYLAVPTINIPPKKLSSDDMNLDTKWTLDEENEVVCIDSDQDEDRKIKVSSEFLILRIAMLNT